MIKYCLSSAAEIDLENILEFGIENFGEAAAVEYFDCLVEHFESITANPLQFPSRDEIREGYRVCVYKSHSIYFRCQYNEILIARILNGQDIEKALKLASII
jgi:toxin ParE1/3/4